MGESNNATLTLENTMPSLTLLYAGVVAACILPVALYAGFKSLGPATRYVARKLDV